MKLFCCTILASLLLTCCTQTDKQVQVKLLQNYPSASGIEYFDNSFYIIGDDAKGILILDNDFNIKDSIPLYNLNQYRFPKEIKPDLESITIVHTKKGYRLLVLGSGSFIPYRNIGWIIDPQTKQAKSFRIDSLYQKFSLNGIREVNVEGLCALPTGLLLVNRGHLGYPENNILFISSSYYTDLNNAIIRLITLKRPDADTSAFSGISGLAYSAKSDKLFLSLSTELTASVYEDGEIGKSYLWVINNISEKLNTGNLAPDKIIDLEQIDGNFKKQKIESVCLVSERKNEVQLALVADNDNGTSTVFKLSLKTD